MHICLRKKIAPFHSAVGHHNLTFLLWSPRQQRPLPSSLPLSPSYAITAVLGDHTVNQTQANTWGKNSFSFGGAHPQHHEQLYRHDVGDRAATEQKPLRASHTPYSCTAAHPAWQHPACPTPRTGWRWE